jgi:hypothetical protein
MRTKKQKKKKNRKIVNYFVLAAQALHMGVPSRSVISTFELQQTWHKPFIRAKKFFHLKLFLQKKFDPRDLAFYSSASFS